MPEQSPLYDLMLMLSSEVEEERRQQILQEVLAAIPAGGGTVERNDDWGVRPMTYAIKHQPSAEYHLIQFQGPTSLLESLSHTLHITDGVLRFRVIKNLPGTPPAPEAPVPAVAAASPED